MITTVEDFKLTNFLQIKIGNNQQNYVVECNIDIDTEKEIKDVYRIYLVPHNGSPGIQQGRFIDYDDFSFSQIKSFIIAELKDCQRFKTVAIDAIRNLIDQ